jgi:hypothetical protein
MRVCVLRHLICVLFQRGAFQQCTSVDCQTRIVADKPSDPHLEIHIFLFVLVCRQRSNTFSLTYSTQMRVHLYAHAWTSIPTHSYTQTHTIHTGNAALLSKSMLPFLDGSRNCVGKFHHVCIVIWW